MSDNGDGAISLRRVPLRRDHRRGSSSPVGAAGRRGDPRADPHAHGIELKGRAGEAASLAQERAAEVEARGRVVLAERRVQVETALDEGKAVAARTKEELQEKLAAASADGDRRLAGTVASPLGRRRSWRDPISGPRGFPVALCVSGGWITMPLTDTVRQLESRVWA